MRLDGVTSVNAQPDAATWTCQVRREDGRLPDVAAMARAVKGKGDLFSLRGVEVSAVGSLVLDHDRPALQMRGTGQVVLLAPLSHKVQWLFRAQREQPITEDERGAFARLSALPSRPSRLFRIVGPLANARTLEVRLFSVVGEDAGRPAGGNIVTNRINNYRNGAYLFEDRLAPDNVRSGTFGRLYERRVDGQQLANPLLVKDVKAGGGKKTLFFAATAHNCLYAFDLDDHSADAAPWWPDGHCDTSRKALWHRDLGHNADVRICGETRPPRVGITSTPVIDDESGFLYVTSYHSGLHRHFLFKIDIRTGAILARRQMGGRAAGRTFNPVCQRQRPGLLLQGGVVYAGFASFSCDADCPDGPYRGWVLGYRASDLSPAGAYTTAPGGGKAGIWQSGSGLVGDGSAIYFLTGNEDPPGLGDSFVKIVPGGPDGLMNAGHFTPENHQRLGCGDTDLGAGGPTYIPYGGKLLGGGKEGKLYLVDSTLPGTAEQEWLAFRNTWHDDPTNPVCEMRPNKCPAPAGYQTNMFYKLPRNGCFIPHDNYQDSEQWSPNIHSAPVFWKSDASPGWGYTYFMPEKEHLTLYRYDLGTLKMETTPYRRSAERTPDGMPGGALLVSAAAGKNGIVWVNIPNDDGQWSVVPGHMVAFNADDLTELWRDDDPVAFAKFNPPVAGAGHVIRPTFADKVIVYGLLPQGTLAAPPIRRTQAIQPAGTRPDPAPIACYSIAEKLQVYGGPAGLQPLSGEEKLGDDKGGVLQRFAISESLSGNCGDPELVKRVEVPAAIYWNPDSCAHVVRGPILSLWEQAGAHTGPYGYPLTDEIAHPDGRREQHFERAVIEWTPDKGALVKGQPTAALPSR